jgi:homoserine O-acetyltransferase
MRCLGIAVFLVACVAPPPAASQEADHPPHHTFDLGEFTLESGDVLPAARVLYVTHGELDAQGSNAVLLPSYFLGTHHSYDFLIGPDAALDPTEYFIVVAEMFGSGGSSSPSNVEAPLRATDFPAVSIRDNVEAMHRLLTEQLSVRRLRAVIGHSMGAQQAFQWAVSHPDLVDLVVAIAGTAKTHPHGVARLESALTLIEHDASIAAGADTLSTAGKRAWIYHWMAWIYSPEWWRERLYESEATPNVDAFLAGRLRYGPTGRPHDYLVQGRAWQTHDVGATPGFDGDLEAALRSIRARVLYMPSATDMYFPLGDAEYESRFIERVDLRPIPSIWGHAAGGGASAADRAFLSEQIARALDMVEAALGIE